MRLIPASLRSDRQQRDGGKERSFLYLNVYDLTNINDYLYWFGLGIFHSGIEVHGMEYGFGAHDFSSSGVFEVEPRSCPGFTFRRSILLGTTDMTRSEYSDEVCLHLTGSHIPGWVNRLARLGSLFNCLLPEQLQVTSVRQVPSRPSYSDDESNSGSIASLESEDDVEARDHQQLLTPTHPDVSFVMEHSVTDKDQVSANHTSDHSL